jgi:DNA-binding NtrC family response regulator
MQSGAIDFLTKPIDEARLLAAIFNAIKKITMVDELQKMKSYLTGKNLEHPEYFSKIISTDDKITNLFKYIESVSKTPLPILLTGETGVGKELFAQAIHKTSESKGNFTAFNAAGTDDNFFSDTLFGHVDGAFTSADKKRTGLLAEAENGTIFIEEIGDLQLNSQIKLLRLLQEKEYYPIGADKPKQCHAKIVCATNKILAEEVKAGRFRADLFYRLNSHVIYIPPLRERIQDIEVLIPHFINKHKTNKNFTIGYPKQLLPILSQYSFPGNIRELEMMVADALATSKGSTIPLEPFFNKIDAVKNIKEKTLSKEYSTIDDFPSLQEIEKQHILKALTLAEQNQSLASRLLGITRQTLHNKLKDN